MKYTILVYENEAELSARADDRRKGAYWGAYRAYTQACSQPGAPAARAASSSKPRSSRRTRIEHILAAPTARRSRFCTKAWCTSPRR